MNILCLNTAFPEAHIALKFNKETYFKKVDANSKHSENLLVAIETLFDTAIKNQNLELETNDILNQINVISCVIGPGSFTGLRISLSTAKAFLTTFPNLKAIGVNSLELLAYEYAQNSNDDKYLIPVLDALSGLYFIAEYIKINKNKLNCITQPKMINAGELKKYTNLISNNPSIPSNLIELTPENLLKITLEKIKNNDFVKENNLIPLYLRPSQAEAELKCKLKK